MAQQMLKINPMYQFADEDYFFRIKKG